MLKTFSSNTRIMDNDDWLFDSIKMYKNLSMYDMQQCVTAMDWVNGKSLCIGTSNGQKHEILELLLPDKMLENETTARLKKDRDFHVNAGGFCNSKVVDLKHMTNTRYCVAAPENRTSLTLWKMGDSNTDLMKEKKTVIAVTCNHHQTKISVLKGNEGQNEIAFGSSLNNVTVVDSERFERIKDSSESKMDDQLSCISHESLNVLQCCTVEGDIGICDFRSDKVKVRCFKNQITSDRTKYEECWTMTKLKDSSNSLLQASSAGEVLLIDTRYLDGYVSRMTVTAGQAGKSEYLCLQACPNGSMFSLSGLDGMVYIYNLRDSVTKETDLEPVFIHEGHKMNQENQSESLCVVKHMWNPVQQDLIISVATDSSVHAWQYSERVAF